MGGKFKVSSEQATDFCQKMIFSLYEVEKYRFPDPFKLSKICDEATKYRKDIIEEVNTKTSKQTQTRSSDRQIETAQKTGCVQGVCESVLAFNNDENRKIMTEATMTFLSKKLLSEMKVTKDMAQKFANPDTYKALEKCVFAQNQEQQLEQTQSQGFIR